MEQSSPLASGLRELHRILHSYKKVAHIFMAQAADVGSMRSG